jgi:hypothetical protein
MNMNQIESARQLLPWYVTGKLSSAEVGFVKEVITACPSLYEEYKVQQQLSQMIKQDPQIINTSIMSTQEQRLDTLMQRIHADQQQQAVITTTEGDQPFFIQALASIKQALSNVLDFGINKWVFTAVASVAVFAVMQTTLFDFFLKSEMQVGGEERHYVSMSVNTPIISSGERIIIQFDQQVSQEEIALFLQTIDGTIIEHPDGSSAYRLTLNKEMTIEQIEALLIKINAEKRVQFAGRSS